MFRRGLLSLRFRPFVTDLPYHTVMSPIDDTLLTDVSWATITETAQFKELCMKPVSKSVAEPKPICCVSTTLRTLALMPTKTEHSHLWVPFLVDTGSLRTYICKNTVTATCCDTSSYLLINGVKVNWAMSSNHFEDINLLGTDVLGHGTLYINYSNGNVELETFSTSPNPTVVVTGHGHTLPVSPKHRQVMYLKEDIKEKLGISDAAMLVIKDPSGNVMGDEDTLHAGVYTFERPPFLRFSKFIKSFGCLFSPKSKWIKKCWTMATKKK